MNKSNQGGDDTAAAAMAGGRLVIDLEALRSNYLLIAAQVAPARTAAVVKADAYGLGAARVAPMLAAAGCRDFFVAHLGEALAIRALLPEDATLYVLNGLQPGSEAACIAANVVPVLNGLEQALAWRDAAVAAGRVLPAALQVDSGMSRLGVAPEEAALLAREPLFRAQVSLKLVMSHLACADVRDHAANAAQRARFEALAALFPGVPRSLSNSGGSFLDRDFHGDLVRPGIALYGGAPNDAGSNPMRAVVALDARVVQVRTIPAGTGVGYGLSFSANAETRIATIAVGYADGWPRHLSHVGAAWYRGVRLPIAGRVSMDSITLDVSALPEATLRLGDSVELLGPHQNIDQVAAEAGTISYEILTSLGQRYHRVYRDGAPDMITGAA